MKKLLLVVFAIILVSSLSTAQEGQMRLGGNLELVLPSGTFGDVAGTGFGGSANFLYTVNQEIAVTGSVGYIMWGEKTYDVGYGEVKSSYSAIPILVGGRYYFTEGDARFYGSAELGLYMFNWTVTTPSYTVLGYTFGGGEMTGSESEFTIAPGIGYEMKIGDNMNLDLAAKYLVISDMNNINIRAGLNFVIN